MKQKDHLRSRIALLVCMIIFGTVGIFRRQIPQIPSGLLALVRSVLGVAFLALVTRIQRKRIGWKSIRKNLPILCLSGAALGLNWVFLFEAYRYTSVAVATLCYYLGPLFVTLVSPLVLKERLTARKGICMAVVLIGMIPVSGLLDGIGTVSPLGLTFGLLSALFYACVILFNKKATGLSPYDKTMTQMAASAIVVLIYALLRERPNASIFDSRSVVLLLVMGILHTGVAYVLYFGAIDRLSAQTVALFSYIDPIVAILLSVVLLAEPMNVWTGIGAALILGATLVSELPERHGIEKKR